MYENSQPFEVYQPRAREGEQIEALVFILIRINKAKGQQRLLWRQYTVSSAVNIKTQTDM